VVELPRKGARVVSLVSISQKKKSWLLYQSRIVAFYQTECWSAFLEIERLIRRDASICPWDVIELFFEIQPLYSGRDLNASDLALFLDGLHEVQGMDQISLQSLRKNTKAEVLDQLRKANWTYDQVLRIAEIIARAIKRKPGLVLDQINGLSNIADGGCQLMMKDVEALILGIPEYPERM
jgi:hypothetical protein